MQVKRDFICLYCDDRRRAFQSLEAVRKHMDAKGHCKVRYGDGGDDEDADLEDFYDYSSRYNIFVQLNFMILQVRKFLLLTRHKRSMVLPVPVNMMENCFVQVVKSLDRFGLHGSYAQEACFASIESNHAALTAAMLMWTASSWLLLLMVTVALSLESAGQS
jgi:hypothetical protein